MKNKKVLSRILPIIIIVELLFFRASGIYDNTPQVVMILINTIISVLLLFRNNDKEKRTINTIIAISLLIRTSLLFFDAYTLKGFFTGGDTESFYRTALGESNELNNNSYTSLLKILIFILGPNRLVLQYINVLASLIAMLYFSKCICLISNSRKTRYISVALLCFGPINMMLSASLLRESIMIMLNILSLYGFIVWYKTGNRSSFLFAIATSIVSIWLHSGMILLLIGYALSFIIYSPSIEKISLRKNTITYLIAIVILLIGIFAAFGQSLTKYFNRFEKVEDASAILVEGGSNYLQFLNNSPLPVMILFTPIKIIYFYISPMIWDVRSGGQIFAIIFSSSIYIWLFINILKSVNKEDLKKLLTIILILISVTYAWGTSNAGTAMRHREKMLPFVIAVYAIGDRRNKK